MAEIRTYYPDGSLERLIVDNRDRNLSLILESESRDIANTVENITYQEFEGGIVTFSIAKTREQLLNITDTFSYVYDYTYYSTGELDTLRTRIFDSSEPPVKLSDVTLKHYTDGRQPEYI